MWEIGFSQEASNYAIDSHPYNEDVLMAIEALAFTSDGFPPEGISEELETGLFLWKIAQHSVIYRRYTEGVRRLWVAVIKPDE
jgi:hypothetical protein